jgi:hypothetical protein
MNTILPRLTEGLASVARDGLVMLLPLVVLFLVFQVMFLHLPRQRVKDIMVGFVLTLVGLTLFLHGVNLGFVQAGEAIGRIVGGGRHRWLLVPLGLVLGFVATLAEPAIRILNVEVERVTAGYIDRRIMMAFLATGVALAVALSMVRILAGIPLWAMVLPGYAAALALSCRVKPVFVAIAFDSGGVVTGPMIATFVMSLCIAAASAVEGGNVLRDGFGMVALVALIPILTILVLGWLYTRKENKEDRP